MIVYAQGLGLGLFHDFTNNFFIFFGDPISRLFRNHTHIRCYSNNPPPETTTKYHITLVESSKPLPSSHQSTTQWIGAFPKGCGIIAYRLHQDNVKKKNNNNKK